MKEALYYKKKEKKVVQCFLCPKNCVIAPDKSGLCRVRKNINGVLTSLVYSQPCSIAMDPIEKKPLYHFMPGSDILSIGTVGCNMRCLHCQNSEISQADPVDVSDQSLSPEDVVKIAVGKDSAGIAYTYNEPTVYYEYMLETAKLAKEKGLKNVIVSNGYINSEPLKNLCKYIDAANIDLKSFDEKFYRKVCFAELASVLDTLMTLKKHKVWLEVTNLVIPTLNDNLKEIEKMCIWIKVNLGTDVPIHFSRFHPMYKLLDLPPTDENTLDMAAKVAKKHLNYVYVGNVQITDHSNTYCTSCKALVIGRSGYAISDHTKKGKCSNCGASVPGVW